MFLLYWTPRLMKETTYFNFLSIEKSFFIIMASSGLNLFEPHIRRNISFSLRRTPCKLIPSVWAHILLIWRVYSADKSSKMFSAIRPIVSSYSSFSRFSFYQRSLWKNGNKNFSPENFPSITVKVPVSIFSQLYHVLVKRYCENIANEKLTKES